MSAPRSGSALREWLVERVADYVECRPSQIRRDVSLAEYGIDSMYALMLCGDLEDHLGLVIDPTLAWDYPTIDAMAAFVEEALSAIEPAPGTVEPDPGAVGPVPAVADGSPG